MRRRDFLAGAAACGFGSALRPAAAARANISSHLPPRIIDVHCHIFNAHDLPIEGFLKKVVIPGNAELSGHFKNYPKAFIVLVHTVAKLLKDHSASADSESGLIDRIERQSATAPSAAAVRSRELGFVKIVIDQIWDKTAVIGLRGQGAAFPADIALRQLQRVILLEVYPNFYCCGATQQDVDGVSRTDVADRLYRSDAVVGRNLRWGMLFLRSRFELADGLHQIHHGRTALMAPALVDFSKWVEDEDHTPLPAQVDAMERIARRKNAPRVHGFVAFDPLRQAIHQKTGGSADTSPLALAQRAVGQKGFIGIKLYPPMGFRPANNVALGAQFQQYVKSGRQGHPAEGLGANTGRLLDEAMGALFAWCEPNGVPIMSHTANSNFAGPGYGERANPRYWESVLAAHPRLRLNLAHAGGFRELGKEKRRENSWEWRIGQMWKRAPGGFVFADISYLSEVVSAAGKRKISINHLKALRETFPATLDRLIYGSDWTMVGRERGVGPIDLDARRQYPELVADYLSAAGFSDAQIENIMFHNSVSFLGLGAAERAAGTRGRLERFYQAAGLDAAWMNVFDQRAN